MQGRHDVYGHRELLKEGLKVFFDGEAARVNGKQSVSRDTEVAFGPGSQRVVKEAQVNTVRDYFDWLVNAELQHEPVVFAKFCA